MAKIIVGNWKMHGTQALAAALVPQLASFAAGSKSTSEIVLCPPALLIPSVSKLVAGSFLAVGAQDVSAHREGAYTGELSAVMLKEAGCRYVIVGHSERRQYHQESNDTVRKKAEAAMAQGIIPIICVGETVAERDAGQALAVVSAQLAASVPKGAAIGDFVLAYEPVWAIGSGKVPATADIGQMHGHIESLLPGAKVLYGGSVKAANAREILAIPGVAGVLVGGASLVLDEFSGIIAASEG